MNNSYTMPRKLQQVGSSRTRRSNREKCLLFAAALLCVAPITITNPRVNAMVVSTSKTVTRSRVKKNTLITSNDKQTFDKTISDADIMNLSPSLRNKKIHENIHKVYEEDDDADDDTYMDLDDQYSLLGLTMEDQMNGFQELQRSTGSEILNEELQKQIDDASTFGGSPDRFLDSHVSGASTLEKIAMSSIPQQLPRPAINAFSQQQKSKQTKSGENAKVAKKSKKQKFDSTFTLSRPSTVSDLNFSHERVTPEQEIQLARVIQRGVALYKIKNDAVEKFRRKITRQEWTDLAGLESQKELRKQVSDYRKAKQLLVTANMGLVHSVVKSQYYNALKKKGVTYEELIQEGSLGLIRASELFDPSRGLRFSTYATIWIKGTLSNSHVVETIKLPLREKNKWNKIVRAQEQLMKEKNLENSASMPGVEPTVEELAAYAGMSTSDVIATKKKMTQAKQVLSLDYEYNTLTRSGGMSSDGSSMMDHVGGGTSAAAATRSKNDEAFMEDVDLAERMQMHSDVVAAMTRNLDSREARLMRLRYGLGDGQTRTISECAEAMGLSQTRTQQIAQQCLKKLREAAEADSLEEYLLTVA